jgi:hypothetical protein
MQAGRRLLGCAALCCMLSSCSAQVTHDRPTGGQGGQTSGGSGTTTGGIVIGGSTNMSEYGRRCDDGSLRCRKVDCPADSAPSTTSVSGVVYDPAGRIPLYNAVVYVVEESELKPLSRGAQCESCTAHFPSTVSTFALTRADGSFTLTDVPAGSDIPLVVQLGKWRRKVTLDYVPPCTNTALEPDKTRLPRNSGEGDLPKIAVTTGKSDALECLLRRIGVDDSEFTPDTGGGRVNLFWGFGAAKTIQTPSGSQALTRAEELWADASRMLDYDMILMSCEGEDNLWNAPTTSRFKELAAEGAVERPPAMHLEVREYADRGGRIFGSHWHHRWINSDDSTPDHPYPSAGSPPVATFATSAEDIGSVNVSVDTSFPKGVAFHDWLTKLNAFDAQGLLPLVKAEHSVDFVNHDLARRWIYGTDPEGMADSNRIPDMVQYFSFTTPVGDAAECGRMVFSDVHVTFGGGDLQSKPFPERCDSDGELTPQEKALEFMIFDLSSCIQKEDDEISIPIPPVK